MNTPTTAVIGAGVMGIGVAQCLAQSGHQTVLIDVDEAILDKARNAIKQNLRLGALLGAGGARSPVSEVLGRIVFSTDYQLVRDTSFVIENTTERWNVKEEVYRKLDALCPADCILAANTSQMSIARLAAITNRPANVIGMHFMNPVPMKKTVEVIVGEATGAQTLERSQQLLSSLGKDWIVVKDSPGFVSNRVLMLTINEAIQLAQEDVASVEQIDKIFRDCFGHKMGPLETADLIGLDTILLSLEGLHEAFANAKYTPSPLLQQMVAAGLLGRKSGRGFYNYNANGAGAVGSKTHD
jgi:3-hydroxybutyryl-CoA dehydrogenase